MKLSNQSRGYLERFLTDNGRQDVDIDAYWDSRFSFEENKKNIARIFQVPYESSEKKGLKQGTEAHYINNARQAEKQNKMSYCDEISFQCQNKCNNNACKTFKKYGCEGEVEPCDTKSRKQQTAYVRSTTGSADNCAVRNYCVKAHMRPPQHNSRTGKPIYVKEYCVTQHPRQCRRGGFS